VSLPGDMTQGLEGYLSPVAFVLRQAAGSAGAPPRTVAYTIGRKRSGSSWTRGVEQVSTESGQV
jgi:hypothetical protein